MSNLAPSGPISMLLTRTSACGLVAVGHQAAVLDPRGQGLDFGVVGADRREAVERDVLDEVLEALLHRVEVAPVVQVLGVDVGDDGHGGLQLQERPVALVGLDHDPVALADLGVGAVGVDDPAVDHGRVQGAGVQQGGDHRGGGGLAVRAAHGDRELQPHQLGQHLGAAHQRQALVAAGGHLDVVGLDRGGIDDGRRAFDIGRVLADEDPRAQLFQPLGIGAGLGVAALHGVADADHDLGDAGHADAADADEVHGAEFEGDGASTLDHLARLDDLATG
jgi:hypothetical protein